MKSMAWTVMWLGLASMLAVAGCPSAAVTPQGIIPGVYIGMMNCTTIGRFDDGTPDPPKYSSFGSSVEMDDEGMLYIEGIPNYEGAVHSVSDLTGSAVETVMSVDFSSDSILVRSRVVMTGSFGTSTGTGTTTIKQSGESAVNVITQIEGTAPDIGYSLSETCQGTLTK